MEETVIKLSSVQIQFLIDTVESFVDNKKLLHIPDQRGEIVALPFTLKSLQAMKSILDKQSLKDPIEIKINLNKEIERTRLTFSMLNQERSYEVNLDEFDEL
ncbi:hypothetical protein BEP19_14275 [Ammoniphilus oxalaticus]|uniref:Uncharacterized protein n=1 Tax=Ammoniphilus oxalaticus TaxID=66863 RepID=A0A419SEY7_9BACL|nr:hypothetical protein [Ammoniphilus oxalaticus]RKD21784.1 hypothetical protein BEP19_14275 [Ammoniphilus oxalaticus]